jgi:multiple sugar transport system substrate-binding protein
MEETQMLKKLTLFLLFISLILSVACGGTNNAEEDTQSEEPAATEAAEPAEEVAPAEEPAADTSGVTEITILWAQWDPADYLQEIGNMYEVETGIKVNVVQEPWGSFGNLFFCRNGRPRDIL